MVDVKSKAPPPEPKRVGKMISRGPIRRVGKIIKVEEERRTDVSGKARGDHRPPAH